MTRQPRMGDVLNQALHALAESDPAVLFLGEDVLDPYGGAFKVSRGLSTRFPDRVLTTPISEQAIIGIGTGLGLCGNKPIVEIMFSDFIALGFDQILNFATKSVSMYGRTVPLPLVVRCPVGGRRGYGPTHSQSLQKHFIGIPNLSLYELSPLHDVAALLRNLVTLGHPAVLFEDKVLYTERAFAGGRIDDMFRYRFMDAEQNYAEIHLDDPGANPCVVIAPGGLVNRCVAAARRLLLEDEIDCHVIVPSRLYPFDIEPLLRLLVAASRIVVVEEGVAGGTWGSEVAQTIHARLWDALGHPVALLSSPASIIPSAPHLEQDMIIGEHTIVDCIRKTVGDRPGRRN